MQKLRAELCIRHACEAVPLPCTMLGMLFALPVPPLPHLGSGHSGVLRGNVSRCQVCGELST